MLITASVHAGLAHPTPTRQERRRGADALLAAVPGPAWLDKHADDRSEKGMVAGVTQSDVFVAVVSPQYFTSYFRCKKTEASPSVP